MTPGALNSDNGTALLVNGQAVSRAALLAGARNISLQLKPASRYAINLCSCRYHFARGFLGTMLAEKTNLLPGNRQPQTVLDVLQRYPDAEILHDGDLEPQLLSALQGSGVQPINLRSFEAQCAPERPEVTAVPPAQVAAIVFTSGSTGTPVAIEKTWGTLAGTAKLLQSRFFAEQGASIVATVPPQHMYGLETTILMALCTSNLVHAEQPFWPADIAQALDCVPAPRVLVTTPVHLKALVQSAVSVPPISRIISATAPLPQQLAERAEALWDTQVMEIYGCSEAGSLASRRTSRDAAWHMLDTVTLARNAEAVEVNAPFLGGPVLLQDRLDILSPDRFHFLGRSADMLNIAGKRASLADLTAQLIAIPSVEDGVLFLREPVGHDGEAVPAEGVQRLAALVVSERDEDEIMHALAQLVDPAFMPRPLKRVARIPRNSVGKATRTLLMQALEDGQGLGDGANVSH